MEKSKKTKKRRKSASCLGVLLIFFMLIFAGCTVGVNCLFRNGNAPRVLNQYCYYNDSDSMGTVVPQGTLVFATQTDTVNANDVVLYRSTAGTNRIAKVSLVLASQNSEFTSDPVYYLTSENDMGAIAVTRSDILGSCKRMSAEMGLAVRFMCSRTGLLFLLILPCLIILLYILALMAASKEAADDDDDDDTDLAFVKSIQEKKKLQQTGELPSIPAEQKTAVSEKQSAPRKRYSDEELLAMEEKEAAERAERIAAIRNRMENRQKTEMPDNVPLFTTEFIAKTHTMQIPKSGTDAAENAVKEAAEKPVKKQAEEVAEKVEKAEKAAVEAVEEAVKAEEAPKPAPKKKKKPANLKNQVASSSFDDLMAFLNAEETKLK